MQIGGKWRKWDWMLEGPTAHSQDRSKYVVVVNVGLYDGTYGLGGSWSTLLVQSPEVSILS